MALSPEVEELRVCLDRVRTMLETLIVRGLRACGADELTQLKAYADELERSGAGHVSSSLAALHEEIEKGDRGGVRTLLMAQTSVRLLERLLTLKVVREQYGIAMRLADAEAAGEGANNDAEDDDGDEEEA